ncbi:MAG: hypothetical protein FJZ59_02735 [Chlamydiae bacterium]|nr:hypothetical protein [Chlamydiota bacterium]
MKLFISLFVGFFIALLTSLFFLPDIASKEFAVRILSNQLKKRYGLEIESAQFSWKGPQVIKGIFLVKGSKKVVIDKLVYENKKIVLTNNKAWTEGHHLQSNQITIDLGTDFQIPFSFDALDIPNMKIDLGVILWQNFGTVKDLLSLLQLKIRIDADIPVWFQEIPASLKNGVLTLSRTAFLVDNRYEFAVWNKIDFSAKQFDLIFGIPKSTIQNVLDIQGLPKNYTITMKFDGPFDNPSLHKSKALKTIGALLLLKQLPLSPIPRVKDSPPERRPFPWEKRINY